MKFFNKLKSLVVVMLLGLMTTQAISQQSQPQQGPQQGPQQQGQDDSFGFHGMMLFGQSKSYVSHLPMFHAPHNFQAVFEVEVDSSSEGGAAYKKLKLSSGPDQFSLAPSENFHLKKMIDGEIQEFEADVYKGHFEKQGAVNLGTAKIKVIKKIFSKDISGESHGAKRWIAQKYFIFGEMGSKTPELYAIHEVTSKPSYDAIFEVGLFAKAAEKPLILPKPGCTKRVCPPKSIPTPVCSVRWCPDNVSPAAPIKKIPTGFTDTVTFGTTSELEVPEALKGNSGGNHYKILETIHLDFNDLKFDHAMGM